MVKGQLRGYHESVDIHFLRNTQEPSGGFKATPEAPVPDLLSTATALFVLSCYKVPTKYPVRDFIEAHWLDSGGFAATLLEDESDIEYTFYGLLALGYERKAG
jgi:prenyltransferase beta subunit